MATITFTYSTDYDDNEGVEDGAYLTPSLEYKIDVPKKVDLTIEDMHAHFNQWLRGLGYHPK